MIVRGVNSLVLHTVCLHLHRMQPNGDAHYESTRDGVIERKRTRELIDSASRPQQSSHRPVGPAMNERG